MANAPTLASIVAPMTSWSLLGSPVSGWAHSSLIEAAFSCNVHLLPRTAMICIAQPIRLSRSAMASPHTHIMLPADCCRRTDGFLKTCGRSGASIGTKSAKTRQLPSRLLLAILPDRATTAAPGAQGCGILVLEAAPGQFKQNLNNSLSSCTYCKVSADMQERDIAGIAWGDILQWSSHLDM